jgi:hypothetical protein
MTTVFAYLILWTAATHQVLAVPFASMPACVAAAATLQHRLGTAVVAVCVDAL